MKSVIAGSSSTTRIRPRSVISVSSIWFNRPAHLAGCRFSSTSQPDPTRPRDGRQPVKGE
jgi:hypothetical protein